MLSAVRNLGKRASGSPLVFSVITVLDRVVPLVLLPIFVDTVGIKDYGALYLFVTLNTFISPVLSFGFTTYYTSKYYKVDEETNKQTLGLYIMSQGLVFVGILVITLIVLSLLKIPFFNSEGIFYLLFFSLLPVFNNLKTTFLEAFRIQFKIGVLLVLSLFVIFLELFFSIYFLKSLELGWQSKIYSSICSYILIAGVSLIFLRKEFSLGMANLKHFRKWLKFGAPLILHRLSGVTLNLGDRFLITSFLGNFELGIYTIAYQVSAPLSIMANATKSAWNPWYYRYVNAKDFAVSRLSAIMRTVVLILIGMALVYVFVIPFFYSMFISRVSFEEINIYVYLICSAFLFQAIYFLLVTKLFVFDRTKALSKITLLSSVVNISGNILLLNEFGILAAAIFTTLAWFGQLALVYRQSGRLDYSLYKKK